ncbi:MAG: xanthine dehydrogenase molybdopterin binding subunit [Alphaproteobacteria bacterium]|nr:xanthine dehydrogenase molybdopterin binding subunit [Alphaproteobacteria bacterium]
MAKKSKKTRLLTRVHQSVAHDSAHKHVSGEAIYIDDIPEPPLMLNVAIGMSDHPHAKIRAIDLGRVRKAPGVVAVLTAADIPGKNDVGPVFDGDPVLVNELVEFKGQAIFAVAAETMEQARRAARLGKIDYEVLDPILTVEEALAADFYVLPPHVMRRGNSRKALDKARHKIDGRFKMGGQDHFYLEGQISLAVPGEDGDLVIYCSTQHPSEIQQGVSHVLGCDSNAITVEVRRMGGGFGGKETQGAQFAALAALFARKTGRPAKVRLDRDDDMIITGKRHDFIVDFEVGFDDVGAINGIEIELASRCGMSAELSGAINDRAMFHCANAYYLPNITVTSHRCKTHTVSNTAFRGFGGAQGMLAMEHIIDEVARHLGKDPLKVRKHNFYGESERNVTHYHMTVEDFVLHKLVPDLEKSSDYFNRRQEVAAFNATSAVLKKGIALTPIKFGISFTTTFLNQAGALIHVYTDGSVHLNHGGTEMGQGLFVKVAQVVAEEFQIDLDRIKITATNTSKVPNTSATAASSGTDMNGAAAFVAANKIKRRLIAFAAEHFKVDRSKIRFHDNHVEIGRRRIPFNELIQLAYLGRVSLSATGFYTTPKIHYDREKARGRPFYYFAYGAAVSEVLIDTLTGEYKLLRADILHDCGRSLNPAIDIGQVEGAFVQGMGWLTMEELHWNPDGGLATHAPSTYKIPVASDIPAEFHVRLLESGRNKEKVIHWSKAVGEPPFMLGISVFHAIKDAVSAVGEHQLSPALNAPATPEEVLRSVDELRHRLSRPAAEAAE